jgi:hypothetical protein
VTISQSVSLQKQSPETVKVFQKVNLEQRGCLLFFQVDGHEGDRELPGKNSQNKAMG